MKALLINYIKATVGFGVVILGTVVIGGTAYVLNGEKKEAAPTAQVQQRPMDEIRADLKERGWIIVPGDKAECFGFGEGVIYACNAEEARRGAAIVGVPVNAIR